jgi:hypothetical protein
MKKNRSAKNTSSSTGHKSQKIEKQADGSIILTLEATDSEEVRSWMMNFGKSISILSGGNP